MSTPDLLQSMLDAVPDAVILVRPGHASPGAWVIEGSNARGNQLLRSRKGEHLGQRLAHWLPEPLGDRANAACDRALVGGEDVVDDVLKDEHNARTWRIAARPSGQHRVVLVLRDVTKLVDRVTRLAGERDDARQDARDRTLFLANMSHELRTPLNGVIGLTEALLTDSLEVQHRESLETIRTSGHSLLRIVNNILDLSKAEYDRLHLAEERFDLRDVLWGCMDLLQVEAHSRGIELAFYVDPSISRLVVGDAHRVRQVITNLIGNAIKFTDTGHVLLTAHAADHGSDPELLQVDVQDTGIGMSTTQQESLFAAFSQVDGEPARRAKGTGLGLALSRRIAEAMGGQMWVTSTPGEGSTFSFTFRAPPDVQQPAPLPPLRPGTTVLVVSPSQVQRHVVGEHLRNLGATVASLSSVDEAVAWLMDGQPTDVAVVDRVRLGGCSQIREAVPRHLPVVLLTDRFQRRLFDEPLTSGDAVVRLPVRREALHEAVAQCATHGRPANSPEPTLFLPQVQGHALDVLVAEDNPVNQLVIQKMLERLGHTLTLVGNGVEAVEAARRRRFDLILMDVQMPEMDGVEAARRIIGEMPAPVRPPIWALTAAAMKGDRERFLAAGMDGYLSKPIRFADLERALIPLVSTHA